ncbi:zinc dependent phospholipase C family protein [Tepidibacter hydrothermalis]|uniref:Zinc dependent phospholipase C family protein n=1 Tax=Tepidibacter hydrothermalis TaxID=3036126 RepID=A0ABY8E9A4_9FIRM|nr:zinc dependent phospholipase C family protein [Tepidibacter hydrothermalis]WFD09483.1 zinc dependent phospholipase C family protein [Tepidibacter hydrothermalis]
MLVQSHNIIANHIHYNIKNHLNIDLNLKMLAYGAMKPDIAPRLAMKKHYKDQSFDFVLNEILKLIDNGLSENPISINRFSTKLGVISHFLSDFFCLPHHNREYYHDKLFEHLKYEKDLHKYFINFEGLSKVKSPYIERIDKDNIKNFIEELHHMYTENKMGFENDVTSSINISSAVGIIIVENSLIESLNNITV